MTAGRTTYWDYVRVEDLLRLQSGREGDESKLSGAEVVFITVHQVYELWFKLVLRELISLRDLFKRPRVPEPDLSRATHGLERITRIFRTATMHWEVVETLSTRDYLEFREKLFPASGFQSAQLREIEILMGLADADRVGLATEGAYLKALKGPDGGSSPALARVEARRKDGPTLSQALDAWLMRTPIRGSTPDHPDDAGVVNAFLEDYAVALEAQVARSAYALGATGPDDARFRREREAARAFLFPDDARRRRIRAAMLFIEGYPELPLLSWPHEVLSRVVEMEQSFLIFRQRHARMVERIIGRRVGTGGSTGLEYLEQTAVAYRIFGDLWAARTLLVPRSALPPIADPRPYDFHAEVPRS